MSFVNEHGCIELTDEECERNVRAFRLEIARDMQRWARELSALRARQSEDQLDLFAGASLPNEGDKDGRLSTGSSTS